MSGAIGGRGIAPAGAVAAFFRFMVVVVIVTAGTRLAVIVVVSVIVTAGTRFAVIVTVIVAATAVVLMRAGGLRCGIGIMRIAVGHVDYSLSA